MSDFIHTYSNLEDEYENRINFRKENRYVYNGRVDIVDYPGKQIFNLYNEPNSGNKIFNTEAIQTIHEPNRLNTVYFSVENINLIQNMIRYQVYIQTNKKHIIGRQSDLQLKIIMRSMYLQYGKNLQNDIKTQVQQLNTMVVKYSVPKIISGVKQYLAYKRDVSTLPVPMDRPKNLSSAGSKVLQPNLF